MTNLLFLLESSDGWWSVIPAINNLFSWSALALVIIVPIAFKLIRKDQPMPKQIYALILLLILAPIVYAFYQAKLAAKPPGKVDALYRVRVTVLNEQHNPTEDAEVWSSLGGEYKRVTGGWEFDIPAETKPKDGKLTIFAAQESAFTRGQIEFELRDDFNLAKPIQLERDVSARIRGKVVDSRGNAVAGARISVAGYEAEAFTTQAGGNFDLPAHAAVHQQVLLQADKRGYRAASEYHQAGDDPATLTLKR